MLRFSIRDLIWLMIVVSLAVSLALSYGERHRQHLEALTLNQGCWMPRAAGRVAKALLSQGGIATPRKGAFFARIRNCLPKVQNAQVLFARHPSSASRVTALPEATLTSSPNDHERTTGLDH